MLIVYEMNRQRFFMVVSTDFVVLWNLQMKQQIMKWNLYTLSIFHHLLQRVLSKIFFWITEQIWFWFTIKTLYLRHFANKLSIVQTEKTSKYLIGSWSVDKGILLVTCVVRIDCQAICILCWLDKRKSFNNPKHFFKILSV